MHLNEKWWKLTFAAFSWGLLFALVALLMGGVGHGTHVFYVLAASPIFTRNPIGALITTPLLWSFLVLLSQFRFVQWPKLLIGCVLCLHYIGAVVAYLNIYPVAFYFFGEAELAPSGLPLIFLSAVALAIYVLGQVAFFRLLFLAWGGRKTPAFQGHGV